MKNRLRDEESNCRVCDKSFSSGAAVNRHLRVFHRIEKIGGFIWNDKFIIKSFSCSISLLIDEVKVFHCFGNNVFDNMIASLRYKYL